MCLIAVVLGSTNKLNLRPVWIVKSVNAGKGWFVRPVLSVIRARKAMVLSTTRVCTSLNVWDIATDVIQANRTTMTWRNVWNMLLVMVWCLFVKVKVYFFIWLFFLLPSISFLLNFWSFLSSQTLIKHMNRLRLLKRNFSTSRVQVIAPEIKKLRRNLDDHIVGQVSNYISPEIS